MSELILVSKMGGVFMTQASAGRKSPVGEMGETEGVLKHLSQRSDVRVAYVGQYRGDLPDGVVGISPDLGDLNHMSLGEEQEEICEAVLSKVLELGEPEAYVQVCGYAPTCSWIDNTWGAIVQDAAVRYTSPQLYVLHKTRAPRICINNDPRSYPREQEMSRMCWPEVEPAAFLSQRTRDFSKIVGGQQYACREVYSGAENWCFRPVLDEEKTIPCTVVAHAHIKDGVRTGESREGAWMNILAPSEDVYKLYERGMRVYGRGWEHYADYDPRLMPGVIKPDQVDYELARSLCGPIVSIEHGFYTGKMRTYLNQGCLPLLYGRGDRECTYDSDFKYVSKDSMLRIEDPGDLSRAVALVEKNEAWRTETIEKLMSLTTPDFSMLDACVSDVLEGRDRNADSWWADYGGYRRCSE